MRTTLKEDYCIILLLISLIKQIQNTDKADICEQGVRIQEFEFA
jgi:hypothetical protein